MRDWHEHEYFTRDLLVSPDPPGIGFRPLENLFPDWKRAFL